MPDAARHYQDFTGTGNTLDMQHPRVLQLLMDSLRYWVTEMHVDGFRFDLASALARELHEVDRLGCGFRGVGRCQVQVSALLGADRVAPFGHGPCPRERVIEVGACRRERRFGPAEVGLYG